MIDVSMTVEKQEAKEAAEEYLYLKIPLDKFTEREEIKSVISNSPLADKSKNDKSLAVAFAYIKKVLEEINCMQTGRYKEILMQSTFVKSRRF